MSITTNITHDSALTLTREADVLYCMQTPKINGIAKHMVDNRPATNA